MTPDKTQVVVEEAQDSTLEARVFEYVCVDPRPNPNGTEEGYTLVHLMNGRTIRIAGDGLYDESDGVPAACVNWEELLSLLDGFRAARKMTEVN